MNILIITQKIDKNDPVLGFFHGWVIEFSKLFKSVIVVCLEKGEHSFPSNVRVCSLGKESGVSRIKYIKNLFRYIWKYKNEYDNVFVHMNQEYVLLVGWLWRILNKEVFLWRNHKQGSWKTRLAVLLSHKVFCTSNESYTASFSKTEIMPVGIDTDHFKEDTSVSRNQNSICYVGRISPVKKIELLLSALGELKSSNKEIPVVGIFGPVYDKNYFEVLKNQVSEFGLGNNVHFKNALTYDELPAIYSKYEVCVNMTSSGSYDKTILESASCNALPVVSNQTFAVEIGTELSTRIIFDEGSSVDLAKRIDEVLYMDEIKKKEIQQNISKYILENHSLKILVNKIIEHYSRK